MSVHFPVSTGITAHLDSYPFIAPSKFAGGNLTGKIVLITGAGKGIGRTTALAFAAAGAYVAALARTSTDINSLISEIKAKNPGLPALAIIGDVLADPAAIIAQVQNTLGPIDILINNAGKSRMARFKTEISLDTWWSLFEVNVKAPMALIHAALTSPTPPTVIITVGSSAADLTVDFMSAYCASKAAILKAIQLLELEIREEGKGTVNYLVQPGSIKTDLTRDETLVGQDMKDRMTSYLPYLQTKLELPADSMVALAAFSLGEEREKLQKTLGGRYWDVEDDLEEILAKSDEIEEKGLYHLRIRKL